eukprot:3301652-Lingulodinium_polyedra.AAC.1
MRIDVGGPVGLRAASHEHLENAPRLRPPRGANREAEGSSLAAAAGLLIAGQGDDDLDQNGRVVHAIGQAE